MINKIVKLTEKQTNDISAIYGLWEFSTECLNADISIFVYESTEDWF